MRWFAQFIECYVSHERASYELNILAKHVGPDVACVPKVDLPPPLASRAMPVHT